MNVIRIYGLAGAILLIALTNCADNSRPDNTAGQSAGTGEVDRKTVIQDLCWSPDGIHITYYLEKGDGQDQIHVMKADGTADRNITNDAFNNIFPGWVVNETIVYGQGHQNAPTKAVQIRGDGSMKMHVLSIESMYARYSPDGSNIAYINEREGMIELVSSTGESLYKILLPNQP